MDAEKQTTIDLLEEKIRPRIKVSFVPGQERFECTEPVGCPGLARVRTFCIGIYNPSNQTVEGCKVKLVKKDPPGAFLPITLKLHNENPQPTKGTMVYANHDFQQEFSIKPHDWEYVDIARYSETRSNQEIELCYATEGKKNGEINRWIKGSIEHTLFITVFSNVGEPVELGFKIWVDKNNRFQCERVLKL